MTSPTSRHALRGLVLGLAAAALMVACGGEGTDTAADYNQVISASGGGASFSGRFESTKGYLSYGGLSFRGSAAADERARFSFKVPRKGHYEVFAWWPEAADGAGAVVATLRGSQGVIEADFDQSQLGGQWNSIGVVAIDPQGGELELRSRAGVRLHVDSIRVQWVGEERPELRIQTDSLPVADLHDPYEHQLRAWSGRGPFVFQLMSGRLPDGLVFEPTRGRLHGAPAEGGEFPLTFAVKDADGRTAERELTLVVAESNDTPGSVPNRPFELMGDRKKALDAGGSGGGANLGALPAIVQGMAEGTWAKVNLNAFSEAWVPADLRPLFGRSNPTPAKIITAWSSFTWDSNRGNLMLYGGGHANYRGNEVYLWRAATQRWERASLPSEMRQDALGNWNAIDSADAAPASAHTYDNTLFFPVIDRMVVMGGAADSNGGEYLRLNSATGTSRRTGFYLFDPAKAHPDRVGGSTGSHVQRVAPWPEIVGGNMWTNRETYLNVAGADTLVKNGWVNGCSAYATVNGKDVAYMRNAGAVYRLTISNRDDPRTDVWERVGVKWNGSGTKASCSYDPVQQLLVRTATQTVPFVYWSMATAGPNNRDVRVVPADPTGTFMPALAGGNITISNCGLEHDPQRRDYKLWCGGGTVWRLSPPATASATGWVIEPAVPASGAVPDATVTNGVLGKWKYIPNLDVFMALQDSVQGNVWIYKPVGWVAPGGGGTPPNTPPSVSLIQPTPGASFGPGVSIQLEATASDPDGTVQRVEFYAGTLKIGEATSAPYVASWSTPPEGTHQITARAIDDDGASRATAAAAVTVTGPPNTPPTVVLNSPLVGAVIVAGMPVSLEASASDTDGSVQRVDFYVGITKVGQATSAPYSLNWIPLTAGNYEVSAIAIDDDGASSPASSATISVTSGGGGGGQAVTVVIQRNGTSGVAIADNYLSSYSMNRNYGSAESLLELVQYNVLLKANIFQSEGGPVPNGAVIESAQFAVYKWTSYAMTYGLHRMLQPWAETSSTWNQRLPGVPWAAPGGTVAGADYASLAEATGSVGYDPGWVSFDVTAHVQGLSGSVVLVNNGWRLHPAAGGTTSLKRFYSSEYLADPSLRPKLTVRYR